MRAKRRLTSELNYFWLYFFPRKTIGGVRYNFRRNNNSSFLRAVSYADYYETEHNQLIQKILEYKSGAFVDVGANVGQTLLKLLSIDPSRRYIGFEPQISSAFKIDRLIKDNCLQSHTILPIGLSDKNGVAQFGVRFSDDTAASSNLDFRPSEMYKYFSNIAVFNGDFALQELGFDDISIIKIDVEGAEYAVLKGFHESINKFEPFVIFECLPEIVRSTFDRLSDDLIALRNATYADIYDYLRSLNYSIYRLDDNSSITLVQTLVADKIEIANYVAAPSRIKLEDMASLIK